MCGRYALYSKPKEIAKIFGISQLDKIINSYNIAPTENVSIIRKNEFSGRVVSIARWGLIPPWTNPLQKITQLINARLETIETKSSFKNAIINKRCIIVADGFFEWKKIDGKKQPYFIYLKNKKTFAIAGIWEKWVGSQEMLNSCCIITTESNNKLHSLHDRSPGIILPENYNAWLDLKNNKIENIKNLVTTLSADEIEMHPVSSKVNKATYKGEDCVERVGLMH